MLSFLTLRVGKIQMIWNVSEQSLKRNITDGYSGLVDWYMFVIILCQVLIWGLHMNEAQQDVMKTPSNSHSGTMHEWKLKKHCDKSMFRIMKTGILCLRTFI